MRRLVLSLLCLLLATPASALSEAPYITPAEVDIVHLLPPPPAPGSREQAADIATLLAMQKSVSAAEVAKAEADGPLTIMQFAGVFGPDYTEANLPKLKAFLTKLSRNANVLTNVAKDYWKRQRPFDADAAIRPTAAMKKSTLDLQGHPTFSFPSGNAAFGVEMAIVLAEMVPEKREQIFARGWEIGRSRLVGGVHYPTDVEAGRLDGAILVSLMMQKPAFRADLAEARAELRAALKLPP